MYYNQVNPLVDKPFIHFRRVLYGFQNDSRKMLYYDEQTDRIMHFYHLYRKPWPQIPVIAVCYTEKTHYIMGQFGACTQFVVIDTGEIIFQVYTAAYRT